MHYQAPRWKRGRRLDQEFLQLAAALVVTPVADPHYVNFAAAADGLKSLNVGSFVKRPNAAHPESISIDAPYCFSEGEHAIHQVQMKLEYFPGARVGAMMAVMKQSDEAILLLQGQD